MILRRKVADFWIHFQNKFLYISYFPVYDKNGEYFGTLEVMQDVNNIKQLEGEKRLLSEE